MRESVRLQKTQWYNTLNDKNSQLILLLNYQAKEIKTYKEIETSILFLVQKLLEGLILNRDKTKD